MSNCLPLSLMGDLKSCHLISGLLNRLYVCSTRWRLHFHLGKACEFWNSCK